MKNFAASTAVKITSLLLMIAAAAVAILCGTGILFAIDYGLYEGLSTEAVQQKVLAEITEKQLFTIKNYIIQLESSRSEAERRYYIESYAPTFSEENSNLFFSAFNQQGEQVASNYQCDEYQYSTIFRFVFFDDEGQEKAYQVYVYVRKELTADDSYKAALPFFATLCSYRYELLWIFGADLLLMLLLMILIIIGAGRRKNSDDIFPWVTDKIPLEIFVAALCVAFCMIFAFLINLLRFWRFSDDPLSTEQMLLAAVFLAVIGVPIVLYPVTSIARQMKNGKWWRSSLLWLCWNFLRSGIRKLKKLFAYLTQNLPLYWKVGAIWCGICFLEMILMLSGPAEGAMFFWLVEKALLTAGIIYIIIGLRKLQQGGEEMAEGNFSFVIDTTRMPGVLQRHGENLNHINESLQLAVEDRMKSERLKTELITNVSHDIKTPITSILNYVDLLQKEELQNEKADEYLKVLHRQAGKLKKLTEDLVEVSKASTGNVPVDIQPMDINVLLMQASAEFEERFCEKELQCVFSVPETPLMVLADGRLMWRVLDNLMGNIAKYALEGTRVYLSAEEQADRVQIVMKNISKYPLNLSSDELTERFVRGDRSRHTEGSGLGLSIAQNLTRLQKGELSIVIDGDLFKATVTLKKSGKAFSPAFQE